MSSRPFVLALFATATLVFTFPLSSQPASRALDLGPDTRLFLWTLAWDVHALGDEPLTIFDANIFYPERRTLAYSEHQIGSALLAAPVMALGGDPLLAMNVVLLLSSFLSGLGAYYLGRELGLGTWGALGCGLVFAFTPPRFFRLGQLHLATVQWLPLCLALVHRYARGGTLRHGLGAAGAFTLQAWSGGQSGLFLALAAACLVAYLVALGRFRPRGNRGRDVVLAGATVIALNLPFVVPYVQVHRELGLTRSLDEARAWAPNAESFIASPTHADRLLLRSAGWERPVLERAKAYLFPGILPLVLGALAFRRRHEPEIGAPAPPRLDAVILLVFTLAAILELSGGFRFGRFTASGGARLAVAGLVLLGIRYALDRRRRFGHGLLARARDFAEARTGVHGGFYFGLGALSLWAALGPNGGFYTALYRVVPGFDFIRVPSRLTILTVLALAVLAGFGLERLREKRPALVPFFLALVLAELAAFPLDARPYAVVSSPMDVFLAEQNGDEPVAVFPIPDPRDEIAAARRHSTYMLTSIAHFRPLVNGYSGFVPPSHVRLFRILATFPDAAGLSELEALGVRYAVFHRDGYTDEAWMDILEKIDTLGEGLSLVAQFDEGRVYELTRFSGRGS